MQRKLSKWTACLVALLLAVSMCYVSKPLAIPVAAVTTNQTDADLQAYADAVVALVNVERAKEGLAALYAAPVLNEAAALRADECTTTFSHTRPNGASCFTALEEAGVSYMAAAENIAQGYTSPEAVVAGWMNSDGHRKNIMNANYDHIGVGVADDGGVLSWSQFFVGDSNVTGSYLPTIQETTTTTTEMTTTTTNNVYWDRLSVQSNFSMDDTLNVYFYGSAYATAELSFYCTDSSGEDFIFTSTVTLDENGDATKSWTMGEDLYIDYIEATSQAESFVAIMGCNMTPAETTTTTAVTTTSTTETTTTTTTESTTTTENATTTESTTTTTTTTVPDESAQLGDVNQDGRISLEDAVLLNKQVAGIVSFNDRQRQSADCYDENGEIDSNDAIALLKLLVRMLPSLPEITA